MSLLNDGYKSNSGNKRIFVAGGVALVVLILIIVALLPFNVNENLGVSNILLSAVCNRFRADCRAFLSMDI